MSANNKSPEFTSKPIKDTDIISFKLEFSKGSYDFFEYFEDRLFPCNLRRNSDGKKNLSLPKSWTDTSRDFYSFDASKSNSLAIRTGNGLVVVDIDTKDLTLLDEHLRAIVIKWLEDKATFIVETTNGYHFYFDSGDDKYSNSVRIANYVDIRGNGGCVLCATTDENSSYKVICTNEPLPISDEVIKYLKSSKNKVEYKFEKDRKITLKNGKTNDALADAVNSGDMNRIIKASSKEFSTDDFTANSEGLYSRVNKLIFILALNPSVPNDSVDAIVKMLVTEKLGFDWDSNETKKKLSQIYSTLIWSDESKIDEDDIFAKAYKTPEELEKMRVDSNPILGKFALKGQMTFLYGPPNVGKTILMMALLKDVTEDVVYLNADDGINGGTEKVILAEKQGYKMILCGTDDNNDSKTMIKTIVKQLDIDKNFYKDKIIIFDTVKKFCDTMNKSATAEFLQILRRITLSGGTIVLLGHTNKHRANDNKLVFEGVGDWVSDMDCVYSLDFEMDEATNEKIVIFENHKSRGVVPETVSYKYDASKDLETYQERVDSVSEVSNEKAEQLKQQQKIRQLENKYEDALLFIVAMLKKDTVLSQSELRNKAKADNDCSCTDNEIRKCLDAFDGSKWKSTNNPSKNNAKEYRLM